MSWNSRKHERYTRSYTHPSPLALFSRAKSKRKTKFDSQIKHLVAIQEIDNIMKSVLVPVEGIEPPFLSERDFESRASTSSATRA